MGQSTSNSSESRQNNGLPDHAVIIVGAGATGLMLATELALAGVKPLIVDSRLDRELTGPRARGINARSIEILDQRGIADRFVSQGTTHPIVQFSAFAFDETKIPSRRGFVLGLPQREIEHTLADRAAELNVTVHYSRTVTDAIEGDAGVTVTFADGSTTRCSYVVGCDGGRSTIRKIAGIPFTGPTATWSGLLVEAATTTRPDHGLHRTERGFYAIAPTDSGLTTFMLSEPTVSTSRDVTLDEVRAILVDVFGSDFGIHNPRWMTRFTDAARQASTYRCGRIFLAGDAAHVHSPMGGQGLNTGIQDAMNLGWKLAQVVLAESSAAAVHGGSTHPNLLDSYHTERHPVGARTQHLVLAQNGLNGPGPRLNALRDIFSELVTMDGPRQRLAAMAHGLDIRYELGDNHPVQGLRMPDVDIAINDEPTTVYRLLHAARAVLLNLTGSSIPTAKDWADGVQLVNATSANTWNFPFLGTVDAPPALLIRPDGYIAWAGDPTDPALIEALTTWFGTP